MTNGQCGTISRQASSADVRERAVHELRADPSSLELEVDLRMCKHDEARLLPIADQSDQAPVDERLVAKLTRVVADDDLVRHGYCS